MAKKGDGKKHSALVMETATRERRHQRCGIAEEIISLDTEGRIRLKRHRAVAECNLDAYFIRGNLTEPQYEAGMKFRLAYLRAVFRIEIGYVGVGSHGDLEMAAILPIHSEELLRAAYSVLSPSQKAVIVDVCGHDHWAGGSDRIETMQRGLERLAGLWRMF